jgi:hypothetical protein
VPGTRRRVLPANRKHSLLSASVPVGSRCPRSHLPPPKLHKEWRLHGLAAPASRGGMAGGEVHPRPPPPPWRPLLTAQQLQRGLAFYGSGARVEAVAAKLLQGKPIKAFTLGGSVTQGAGASNRTQSSYPALFFQFLNATFPHRCGMALTVLIAAPTMFPAVFCIVGWFTPPLNGRCGPATALPPRQPKNVAPSPPPPSPPLPFPQGPCPCQQRYWWNH